MKQLTFIFLFLFLSSFTTNFWGFYAHKMINRHAIYSLPPEMVFFYKKNIDYLSHQAVAPDKRRYAIKEEAPRHYIDLDDYGILDSIPHRWQNAVDRFSEDTLMAFGIVPWHVQFMKYRLTEAFKHHQVDQILKLSAEIGHYIGDANVPLHTTKNYNGQLTNQLGIHGLWESRLPEIFSQNYDLWIGRAEYIENTNETIWSAVITANAAVDSVLDFDKKIKESLSEDEWYSFEQRGMGNVKVYSEEYSTLYHEMLNKMVERQLRKTIKMVADFWFTCWVDAGQPDLEKMVIEQKEIKADSIFNADTKLMGSQRAHEH